MIGETNTAHLMAEFLKAAQIPFVFGYPGTSNIEFMEGARQRGVETILARREGTAAFMAEAFGLLTGRPGICISTLGPGSTALVNGVAAANLDRAPIVAISGQIGRQRESYITHQVVDHGRMFAPITKWAGRVEVEAVDVVMRKALRVATAERPGAVHLTVNSDVANATAPRPESVLPPLEPSVTSAQLYQRAGSEEALTAARHAKRPLLVVGPAAARQNATESLLHMAEVGGLPVIVSPMAKGVFPEDHDLFAGVLDMACADVVWELVSASDLVVVVGFDPVELVGSWRSSSPMIHIDALPNTDQVYQADYELVGFIPSLLQWLAPAFTGATAWGEDLPKHRARLVDSYYGGHISNRLNPTDVIDGVRVATEPDSLVTADVGSHKMLVGQGWQTISPRSVLMSNGLSSMGFSLPAAIAAKLTHPDRQVVCMTGDGGFAMVQGELRLASSLGLGILVVVFTDNSLNRIELKQMALGYPSTATRLDPTDIELLAESMECNGIRVDDRASLDRALRDIRHLDRPLVVDARIDPSQYESQF